MPSPLHGRRIPTRLGGLDAFVWSRRPAPPRSDKRALLDLERGGRLP